MCFLCFCLSRFCAFVHICYIQPRHSEVWHFDQLFDVRVAGSTIVQGLHASPHVPKGFFAAQCWHLFKWCAWVERGICSKTETTSECFTYFGWFCILCRVPLSRYSEVRDVGLIWTLRELCGEFVRLLSPLNRVVDSRKQFYNVLYTHIYIYICVYIIIYTCSCLAPPHSPLLL